MFDLSTIRSAKEEWNPLKVLIYGVQGLGKTTFGCTFQDPVLVRAEDGACSIDVPTFPHIRCYEDMMRVIDALHGEHEYKTLVLDTLDWLEPMVWAYTCQCLSTQRHVVNSIEEPGYGRGYVEADKHWRYMMGGFDSLRYNKNMNIILVAHAEIKRFEPPDCEAYDRYQIKLHKRAWGLWQEWSDMTLFVNYRRSTIQTKDGKKEEQKKFRAVGQGDRSIYCDERPAYLAKNRWGLPHEIIIGQDKAWANFHMALHNATEGRYALPFDLPQDYSQDASHAPNDLANDTFDSPGQPTGGWNYGS